MGPHEYPKYRDKINLSKTHKSLGSIMLQIVSSETTIKIIKKLLDNY